MNRKEFIRGALATAAVGMSGCAGTKAVGVTPTADMKIRSALLHLGMNMWRGYRAPDEKIDPKLGYARTECPTEPAVWDAVVRRMPTVSAMKYTHGLHSATRSSGLFLRAA